MFTGLVQDIGTVKHIEPVQCGLRIEIETGLDLDMIAMGASVCCAGCCLTVVDKTVHGFCFDVSGETLSRTTLGSWVVGASVNLEPSLKMGDELGGHFVFGHVDAVARILSITPDGASRRIEIELPKGLGHLVAVKGSITLDGVSLTVNSVGDNSFGVNIIPHTWDMTSLGQCKVGDTLNLEVDMLARYVARMREVKA